SVSAGRDIRLDGVAHETTIRTTDNVTLSAGGAISEASNGWIAAKALTTGSHGATSLGGPNQVSVFNGTSGGDLLLNNTGALQLTGIAAAGALTLDNI